MDTYFACPGKYAGEVGRRAAIMSYEASGRRVYRTEPPAGTGSLMVVSCEKEYSGTKETFARDILGECRLRRFRGVFLDREEEPGVLLRECVRLLAELLQKNRMALFLSPALWFGGYGTVVCSASPLSGTLHAELMKAKAQYGTPAGELRVLREEITLPVTEHSLHTLTKEELDKRITGTGSPSFFCEELCTRYFSYSRSGVHRFVLYDTAETLSAREKVLEKEGVGTVFYYYPEVREFISSRSSGSPSPPLSGEA